MLISQTAEYALRALACLALHGDAEPVPARDLSVRANVPPFYLSKIMRRLVEAGLVDSQRGHGGGFRVARDLAKIRFIDILDAVDQGLPQETCAFGFGTCGEADPCVLHPFWSELKEQFSAWAERHTLQDVRDQVVDISAALSRGRLMLAERA